MGIAFWILLVVAILCLCDVVYLIKVMCGANAPTITEYLCYIFGVIPLPSLFIGILPPFYSFELFSFFLYIYILQKILIKIKLRRVIPKPQLSFILTAFWNDRRTKFVYHES